MSDDPADCGNCEFFAPPVNRMMRGTCRRFPRAFEKLLTEWCGEHQLARAPVLPSDIPIQSNPGEAA